MCKIDEDYMITHAILDTSDCTFEYLEMGYIRLWVHGQLIIDMDSQCCKCRMGWKMFEKMQERWGDMLKIRYVTMDESFELEQARNA